MVLEWGTLKIENFSLSLHPNSNGMYPKYTIELHVNL